MMLSLAMSRWAPKSKFDVDAACQWGKSLGQSGEATLQGEWWAEKLTRKRGKSFSIILDKMLNYQKISAVLGMLEQ